MTMPPSTYSTIIGCSSQPFTAGHVGQRDGEKAEPYGQHDHVQHGLLLAVYLRPDRSQSAANMRHLDADQDAKRLRGCRRRTLAHGRIRNRDWGEGYFIKIPYMRPPLHAGLRPIFLGESNALTSAELHRLLDVPLATKPPYSRALACMSCSDLYGNPMPLGSFPSRFLMGLFRTLLCGREWRPVQRMETGSCSRWPSI